MSERARAMARLGEFHLQEAVLEVLTESHPNGFGIGAAEVGRRAGIYRDTGAAQMNDAIVTGILNQLHEQGKVERADQENERGGWRLVEREFERRRGDIELR